MRILVAPTAFKGSYSPAEVAKAMSDGVSEFARLTGKDIYIDALPLADGGDGTVEALALSTGSSLENLEVSGSLAESRKAYWLNQGDCAVVELASACGIAGLASADLRPLSASSRGLGAVLKHVIESTEIPDIVVALGGSASTDGGSAALYELGAKFFDSEGRQFVPTGGGSLRQLARVDLSGAILKVEGRKLTVATDVSNPLLGPQGAACIFAAQKGASPPEIALLDQSLTHFADLVESETGSVLRDLKGAGAAGGTAFGLAALGAEICPGFDWLAALLRLPERLSLSDLVITGEGRTDSSSWQGKVVGSLHELCLRQAKPLWIFSGSVDFESISARPELLMGLAAGNQLVDCLRIKQAVFDALAKRFGI